MESETRRNPPSDKLTAPWLWLEPEVAALLAQHRDRTMETLRKGQGLLGHSEYVALLTSGEIEVIIFQHKCAALVTWGKSTEGLLLNILTVTGTMEQWEEALSLLEAAARASGANAIVSIGHVGWSKLVRKHGFKTRPKLFMRKDLS